MLRLAMSKTRTTLQTEDSLITEREREREWKRAKIEEPCTVCAESIYGSHTFSCRHTACTTCLCQYLASCISNMIGRIPSDIRCSCPGASNGKKCSYPLEPEFVLDLLHTNRKLSLEVQKACSRLDEILRCKLMATEFPEYTVCPKCSQGYGASECDEKWAKCRMSDCLFEFCPSCDIGIDIHSGKTCLEVAEALKLQVQPDTLASKHCPACRFPIEKISGCDHITCKNCSYEFCWICNASYYPGHLKLHEQPAFSRIAVQVPGQPVPLQITTTPHTLYKMQPGTGVQPSTVTGQDIPSLFRTHQVVKMVKISTTDPVSGKTVFKEGILLKKLPQTSQ